jgi:SPP1 gp7 family putative phage head morphogenesis protein
MAAQAKERSPFEQIRGIERRYAMTLRKLATQIGNMTNMFDDLLNSPAQRAALDNLMRQYSDTLTPWARSLAGKVVQEVDRANRRAYAAHAQNMSRGLKVELQTAPTGEMQRLMMAEQVELIRSLPIEAAQRVHAIARKNLLTSVRAEVLEREIMRTGEVTRSRATLIARTETSRTSSSLTMARAVWVGSVEYAWRTSRDDDVRPSHDKMESQIVQWADPPTLDGLRGHAGCLPNCRCYPEPLIPRD